MTDLSQSTKTPWAENVILPHYPMLTDNTTCDVCIIGAGIAGLTSAYLLAKKGKKVCVVESLNLGDGQTGHTTAHITYVLDTRYHDLIKKHGLEKTSLVLESHQAAMNKIKQIVAAEKMDCDLTSLNGYQSISQKNGDTSLKDELQALYRIGLKDIRAVSCPLPHFSEDPCILFPQQMQFHPLKYLLELGTSIVRMGGSIHSQTHVKEVLTSDGLQVITSEGYKVTAKSVIVATNTPINNTFAIHTKQMPYRTYAMAFSVPKDKSPFGLFWDDEEPYHYLRVQPYSSTHNLLIVGGEDHKTGQNDNPQFCFERLMAWTRKKFPYVEELIHQWSGQVMETIDGLPYLGRNPMDNKNVYVITGHSGMGMVQSTLGAMIISDQIIGIKNSWEELYEPSRFSFRSLGEYFKENGNVAAQYKDWFSSENSNSVEDIKIGEGKVITSGLKKIAVYRSLTGNLESYSAACPHLGGVVHWNSVEKSWDCPCHGSRFNCNGKVIEGPAVSNLQPIYDTDPLTNIIEPLHSGLIKNPPLA